MGRSLKLDIQDFFVISCMMFEKERMKKRFHFITSTFYDLYVEEYFVEEKFLKDELH